MSTDTRTATDTNAVTLERATEADGRTTTLRDVGQAFRRAMFTVVIGASGSGTLGSTGSGGRSETGLTRLRRDRIGSVLQRHNPASPR
ncbi:ABC-type lipoprotein export system ATPase subunit [Catenulispora sp. EB89]|uniref:hypothetical protein n=1 Tax=Catenulispora sp. EB89 TaxID=3156257 RepID=UPI0035179C10